MNTSLTNSTRPNSSQLVCSGIGDGLAERAVLTAGYCVILLLSLFGNTLIIVVVYRNPRMWTTSNYLIVNMAASDLLLPFFAVPRLIVEVLVGRERWLIGGATGLALCKLAYFFQDVSTAVSVQSLIAITAERFYAVTFPLKASAMKSKIKIVIPLIWLAALGLHSPYLHVFNLCKSQGMLYCCQKWSISTQGKFIYFVLVLSLVFAVPLITMIVLYTLIIFKLHGQRLPPGDRNSSTFNQRLQRERQNRNILKLAVTIVVVFFLCFSPVVILSLLLVTGSIKPCVAEIFRAVAKFFAQSNCSINAFIYYAFNIQFRRGFVANLNAVLCCGKANVSKGRIGVLYTKSSQTISLIAETKTSQSYYSRRRSLSE